VTVAFLETTGDRHEKIVAGVMVLERKVREVAKAGATKAVVAAKAVEFARPVPIPVEFVEPGTAAPEGARRERADVLAGIELVDDEAARRAEWALIRGMNKSFQGPVDALINWRFSMRITRVLGRMSMRIVPNHITLFAIAIGFVAIWMASRGGWESWALAGVLLETNSIFDSCDGELARLRFQYSKVGQWLDNLSDDVVDNVFIAAVGYSLGGTWAILGAVAGILRASASFTQLADVYRRTGTGDTFAFRFWFEKASASTDEIYNPKAILTWIRSLGRRDTYVFVFMLALLADFPYWVVVHGLLIGSINFSLVAAHFTVFRSRRR
jgi:phosphatidylglycerophosphate synthase